MEAESRIEVEKKINKNEDESEGVFGVKADGRNGNSQFVKIVNFRIEKRHYSASDYILMPEIFFH